MKDIAVALDIQSVTRVDRSVYDKKPNIEGKALMDGNTVSFVTWYDQDIEENDYVIFDKVSVRYSDYYKCLEITLSKNSNVFRDD